jgi:hypothetical protein
MPLPILQHPTYEVYLKSLNKKVKFRPFLVKEEKIMLMAKESNDLDSIINAIKQIIQNCCLEEIDVDSLPTFDVEMFFIHLRMRSVGEKLTLNYTCDKIIPETGQECNLVNDYELDLEKINYTEYDQHKTEVKLTDKIGVKMGYPKFSKVSNLVADKSPLQLIADNIKFIYDEDQVYDNTQYTKEELISFLENLSTEHMSKLLDFFITSPKVVIKDTAVCKKCNQKHQIYSEELYNFFI